MRRQPHEIAAGAMLSWVPRDHEDWNDPEQREIERIRAACVDHPDLELEGSRTDEGDPWFIVCAREPRERIILHLARIDRCYVLVLPCRSRLERVASMTQAVGIALREIAHHRTNDERLRCVITPFQRSGW